MRSAYEKPFFQKESFTKEILHVLYNERKQFSFDKPFF